MLTKKYQFRHTLKLLCFYRGNHHALHKTKHTCWKFSDRTFIVIKTLYRNLCFSRSKMISTYYWINEFRVDFFCEFVFYRCFLSSFLCIFGLLCILFYLFLLLSINNNVCNFIWQYQYKPKNSKSFKIRQIYTINSAV